MNRTSRKYGSTVLKFLIKSDYCFFTARLLAKKIDFLNAWQVSFGLRVLEKDGYVSKWSTGKTWEALEKLKKLRVKL